MMVQFLEPVIIVVLLKMQIVQASNCEIVKLETDEVFIQKVPHIMLIESDTNDYSDFEKFDWNIISQIIKVPYQGEEQIISSLIVDPINVESLLGWLLCKFLKTENYIISCMQDINFQTENNSYMDQIDSLILTPQIQSGDKCEEFYFNDHSEFVIFCFNFNMLNIYSVDFNNTTILKLSYQLNLEEYIQCKRKYVKLDENLYIFAFYQCQRWGLFSYYNNKLKILLDQQIAQQDGSQMNTQVENIQFCLETTISQSYSTIQLYLITDIGYYQYFFNKFYEFNFLYYVTMNSILKQLLLTQTCKVQYSVTYLEAVNKTIFSQFESEQEFEGTLTATQFYQDILFVQINNELQVYFNQYIKQYLKINPSYFVFYDNYNLIQQVDEINKVITFYKVSYAKNILKPTKKYIFWILSGVNKEVYFANCTEIKKVSQIDVAHSIFKFQNKCQNETIFYLQKNSLAIPFGYEILLPQSQGFMNIYDKYAFVESCPILKKQYLIDYNLIFYTNQNDEIISMQSANSIQIIFCNNTNKFKLNTANYDVFSYENFVLLVNKSERKLKFVDLEKIHQGIIELKIQGEILSIHQFETFVIFITKNITDFMVLKLDNNNFVKLKENTIKLIYKLYLNSLTQSNIVKQNPLFKYSFYISFESYQFIQFTEYMIIQLNSGSQIYKIGNIQIIYLKIIVIRSLYYLLAVHLNRNEIIEYYFNLDQISIFNNYTLDQYEIIRPLKYYINNNNNKYFAIAVRNETDNVILIFAIYISKPLKLIHAIKTKRLQFFFKEYQLFYYDDKDEIMILILTDFVIQIKSFFQLERVSSVTSKNFSFQIVPLNKNISNIEIQFEMKSYNLCFKIFSLNDNLQVKFLFSKNINFNILDYFVGPINIIKILNNDNIIIKGPLLLSENLIYHKAIESISIKEVPLPQSFQNFLNKEKGILVKLDEDQSIMIPNILNNQQFKRKLIIINAQQTMLLLIEVIKTVTTISILQIKDDIDFLIEEKKIKIHDTFTDIYYIDPIIYTGNLIVFIGKNQYNIYSINETEIYFQQRNDLSLSSIIKVRGQNDFYISLSYSGVINIFHILTLQSNQLQEIGQTIISQSTFDVELQKYLQLDENDNKNIQLIDFLECTIFQGQINLLSLQILTRYSVIAQIQVNLSDFSSSYKVLKIIRNTQDQAILTLAYYSQNILILKSLQNSIYIYNLQEERKLYDYIGCVDLINWNFYPLNTTHMLIYSDKGDNLFIGELGYLIQVKDEKYQEETFTLIVQNQISEVGLKVSIEAPYSQKSNIDVFIICIWILIMLLFVLFILYFLIRRLRLKQKQINNDKY